MDECYSEITAPWRKPTIYLGYANNFTAVVRLPWYKVLRYNLDTSELDRRILEYRKRTDLQIDAIDGEEESVLDSLHLINDMLLSQPYASINSKFLDDVRSIMPFTKARGVAIFKDDLIARLRKGVHYGL